MFTFFHSEALLPLFSIFLSSFSSVNWNELLNKLVIQTWDIYLLFNYLFELLHIFSARKPKFLLRFSYFNCLETSGLTLCKNRENGGSGQFLAYYHWGLWRPVLHLSPAGLVHSSSGALGGPDTSILCSGSSSVLGLCWLSYGSSRRFFWFTHTDS